MTEVFVYYCLVVYIACLKLFLDFGVHSFDHSNKQLEKKFLDFFLYVCSLNWFPYVITAAYCTLLIYLFSTI